MFSSDNGPWLSFELQGGSAGPLRAGKGTTFEGGQRVPTVFWWPNKIKPGTVVTDMGSTLDMMATLASLSGATPPADRTLDSYDLSPTLLENLPSPRREFYYWTRARLHAVRSGPYKLHQLQREPVNYGRVIELESPELFQLEHDVAERFNIAKDHPMIVEQLKEMMTSHQASIVPVDDNLAATLKSRP